MRFSLKPAAFAAACLFALSSPALDVSNRYRSPRNAERAVRKSTELIVLHTTEAPARSSLNKLSERGEAHYCVTEEGRVYRIVDRDREAFHAGRSMWGGREDVDKFSVGIECVGYHDKAMGTVQLAAIRDLVKMLQKMYRIPDERVVCHSHVAYGAPNRWQRRNHRGRKRCGMLFAMPSVRKILELKARPAFDPDTRAKRLAVGDDYLNRVLYGSTDTMRAAYAAARPADPAKDAGGGYVEAITRWLRGAPAPSASTPAPSASTPAPSAAAASPPSPPPSAAASAAGWTPRSIADLKSAGYVLQGSISREQTAMRLAGRKWNSSDTYYTIRNKVIPGSRIDPAHIEKGMGVWVKK